MPPTASVLPRLQAFRCPSLMAHEPRKSHPSARCTAVASPFPANAAQHTGAVRLRDAYSGPSHRRPLEHCKTPPTFASRDGPPRACHRGIPIPGSRIPDRRGRPGSGRAARRRSRAGSLRFFLIVARVPRYAPRCYPRSRAGSVRRARRRPRARAAAGTTVQKRSRTPIMGARLQGLAQPLDVSPRSRTGSRSSPAAGPRRSAAACSARSCRCSGRRSPTTRRRSSGG